MPNDIVVYLSEDELTDVVEYLLTLKTPSLTPDSWLIAGPFENGPDRAGLDKAFGPEKGIDLKATYDGKAGKVSWRTIQAGGGNYFDLQAYHGAASPQSVSYLYRQIESPADQEAPRPGTAGRTPSSWPLQPSRRATTGLTCRQGCRRRHSPQCWWRWPGRAKGLDATGHP